MSFKERTGFGAASARASFMARSRPGDSAAKRVMYAFDMRRAARQARQADDIGARDESLRPEAEHDAVADPRRRRAPFDHAVIVDRGGRRNLHRFQRGG